VFIDIYTALRDHETFSSAAGPAPMPGPPVGLPLLAATDPPYHDQLRGLVNRAFTPRRIAQSAPRVHAWAKDLVAKIPEDTAFDVVEALSIPLPVAIIAEILGVLPERQADFRRWSDAFVGLLETPPDPAMIQATGELLAYFHELEEQRLLDRDADGRLLLRPPEPLAEGNEREHQPTYPSVSAEED
jgi:cytochrome P450